MTTHLPKQMTLLSLNKKEILQLPGFDHLKEYLLKELKTFLREFINRHSSKKRGMTVAIYLQKYSQDPKPYQPSHPTQRKKRTRKQAPSPMKSEAKVPRGYAGTRDGHLIKNNVLIDDSSKNRLLNK